MAGNLHRVSSPLNILSCYHKTLSSQFYYLTMCLKSTTVWQIVQTLIKLLPLKKLGLISYHDHSSDTFKTIQNNHLQQQYTGTWLHLSAGAKSSSAGPRQDEGNCNPENAFYVKSS